MTARAAARPVSASRLKRKRGSGPSGNGVSLALKPVAAPTLEIDESEDEVPSGSDSEEEGPDDKPINTGPKGKTVLSKVTGRPKRVYPDIEPDYDSDSSTEDVCVRFALFHASNLSISIS